MQEMDSVPNTTKECQGTLRRILAAVERGDYSVAEGVDQVEALVLRPHALHVLAVAVKKCFSHK